MGFGILTYLMWGLFPAYFPLLEPAAPVEIIAHRIFWTFAFMALLMTVQRKWGLVLRGIAKYRRLLPLAAILIACNWLVYVVAVNSGHVAEAALGYFINPLVSIFLGMLFFQERLRTLQKIAVALAFAAVIWLSISQQALPLIPLALAFSFGFYGVCKKRIELPATVSLTAEALIILPIAVTYWIYLSAQGQSTFSSAGTGHALMLVTTGLVTAVPLLTFGVAAQRISLSTLGILQYITPTMQFLWAVFVMHEAISTGRWIGFVVIWVAVSLYLIDVYRQKHPKVSSDANQLHELALKNVPK